MRIVLGINLLVLLARAGQISEQCEIHEESRITCRCIGNEEFFLPEGYNYENVTSLRVAGCASANLHFSSLTEANRIEEIIVQNITNRLAFELFVTSKKLKVLQLSNVRKIPIITHDTFTTLNVIDNIRIEDTAIERFEEQFFNVLVIHFSMINVTIERIDGLNFSEKGQSLCIANSEFLKVTDSTNFVHFSRVEILDSKFEFEKPGRLLIEGDTVVIENSTFSNATMNFVATNSIMTNATCADGKSSLRLSSRKIDSVNNKLPTEIVYARANPEYLVTRNNTVCIAGNCKCRKGSGQSVHGPEAGMMLLNILLLTLSHWRG